MKKGLEGITPDLGPDFGSEEKVKMKTKTLNSASSALLFRA
jgi:hypothetical protein